MAVRLNDPASAPTDYVRDQWGRPLVVPPGSDKPIPYTRASSAAKTVEDTWNLEMHARRNVAYGMARDASLVARVLAVGGEPSSWDQSTRQAVNKIHADAAAVALAHRAADIGTAVHRMTELVDRGQHVDAGPYAADLVAYAEALARAGLTVVHVECRMVCDALAMAGTVDRIVLRTADGTYRILDIKTGATVDYGALGWAAQLAAYAHGELYDVDRAARLDTPPLDRSVGYVAHLPAGQGRCTLYELDLVAGHRAAVLANEIRAVRREARRWITPIAGGPGEQDAPEVAASAPGASDHPAAGRRQHLRDRFRALPEHLQEQFRASGVDADDLDAVERRLSMLEAEAATPDEGVDAAHMAWDELEADYLALPEPVRSWFSATVAESRRAGVAFHAHTVRTARRWHLYHGLLEVAAMFDDADDGLVDVVRGLAAHVVGDDALFPTVPLGHVLGAMGATQAEAWAQTAELYAEGHLAADVTGPRLRLVPA